MKIQLPEKPFRQKWVAHLCFILVLLAVSYYYNYHEIITYRPTSVHQWRNSVSASIALNYYHEGEFLHPRTHNMQVDNYTSDITITEFPLIYYFIALLYRIFGFHEFIYRLVNVLIGFTGLYFLFRLGLRTFRNTLYAMFLPLLIFSSPIYVYYINNFIPDATSLSIVFIGLYYFYRFYENQDSRYLGWSLLFLGFAGLIKTPALLVFFALIGIYVLDRIFKVSFKEKQFLFKHWPKSLLLFAVVLLATIAWYAYAKIYTDIHGGVVSLVEIRPIWVLSRESITDIWKAVTERYHSGNYHAPLLLNLTALLFLFNLLFWKKHNRLVSFLSVLTFIGGIGFSLLFYRSLKQHDYYQMNNLMIPLLVFFNFFLFLKQEAPRIFKSWITKGFVIIFLGFLVYKCNIFMAHTYYGGWFYDYAITHYNNRYDEITPHLRSLGIERHDKVYCTYDPSINISLYLMDQKGFTDTDILRLGRTFSQKVELFSQHGLKYVIVGDYDRIDAQPEDIGLEKIGTYKEVGIYKVPGHN
jgi:4-amino-4-deoxy-L-arabinose transferase-like glycosyltransferase